MHMTKHARTRAQQRGIPALVVDLLVKYGTATPSGDNTWSYHFDKKSRRAVLAYAGTLSRAIEEYLDYYAIVGKNDEVITVAPRLGRVRH